MISPLAADAERELLQIQRAAAVEAERRNSASDPAIEDVVVISKIDEKTGWISKVAAKVEVRKLFAYLILIR